MTKEGSISIILGVISTICGCIIIPVVNKFAPEMAIGWWVVLIIAIVFAIILCIAVPLIISHIKRRNKKLSENINQLKKTYTSLFAEDNKLKTEKITITKIKKQRIEGVVEFTEYFLDGNTKPYKYTLKGRYENKIITAEYYGKTERGAINLKLVSTDKDIFSGFCSFSKINAADDEIRVSPYVWVAGETNDLMNGTFEFCTTCHNIKLSCCCASDRVDMPLLLNFELERIKHSLKSTGKHENNYSTEIPVSQLRQMNYKKNQHGEVEESCVFFDETTYQCKIYDNRPLDCRLFPFDVRFSQDEKEYVVGYYSNICKNIPEKVVMQTKAHILRPYFFLLYPYLNIYTLETLCPKLSNAESGWIEIGKFRDFIF